MIATDINGTYMITTAHIRKRSDKNFIEHMKEEQESLNLRLRQGNVKVTNILRVQVGDIRSLAFHGKSPCLSRSSRTLDGEGRR